jgi:hypothetical protein
MCICHHGRDEIRYSAFSLLALASLNTLTLRLTLLASHPYCHYWKYDGTTIGLMRKL